MSTKYTKKDISKEVASRMGKSFLESHSLVSEVFNIIQEMLSGDDHNIRIEVRGFGTLQVKPTKAKPRARNPRTNEEVFVPPHRKTHFKPGRILKEKLSRPI
ncbi:MAG: HU family DNA-binding protein [Fidelibacterota bacterium]